MHIIETVFFLGYSWISHYIKNNTKQKEHYFINIKFQSKLEKTRKNRGKQRFWKKTN